MYPQMWKRLEKVARNSAIRREQIISVIQDIGETDSEVEGRIDRWQAGDANSGIRGGEYEGGELFVIWRYRLVKSDNRSMRWRASVTS